MPAELVTGQDAEDVATYVASVAGVPGAKPPQLAPPQLFAEKCGICHALAAAGTTSATGPDLDEALAGKDAAYIEEAIVDPNAEIAPGLLGRDHAPGLRDHADARRTSRAWSTTCSTTSAS